MFTFGENLDYMVEIENAFDNFFFFLMDMKPPCIFNLFFSEMIET